MTDPTDPTAPFGSPENPIPPGDVGHIEAVVRDALAARAAEVDPPAPSPEQLAEAMADDDRARRRRTRTLVGAAVAAALVVGVVATVALGGDHDHDQVVSTATDPATTSVPATATTTTASPSTTGSTAVVSTDTTQVGPTTSTTAVGPGTTATTAVAPPPTLPGASTDPRTGPGTVTGTDTALVSSVRTARNPGFDRVVIEFSGSALPGWSVQYVDPPITQDGSGAKVAVSGTAYIRIRLERAAMHDPATGQVTYTGPDRVTGSGTTEVTEVVATGDFEGVVTWVIGVRDRVPFRVQTLSGPPRLVVDLAAAS